MNHISGDKKMRIAVWHNLLSGGARRALYGHIKGLSSQGHTIEIWSPPSADIDYLSLREIATCHVVELNRKRRSTDLIRSSILRRYNDVLANLDALDDHCKACGSEINAGSFDVLFANSSSLFYNSPIGRYVDIPSLIYLQEPYRWLYEALPSLPWAAPGPRKNLFSRSGISEVLRDFFDTYCLRIQVREELLNAKAFNRILVNSFFSRESVLRAYGLDSSVCYLGIDTDLFTPSGRPKLNYVVGLGAIYPLKRVELAIKAIGTIDIKKRPRLIWIGNFADRWYENQIRKLAEDLAVSLDVKVSVTDQELIQILQDAAAMIYTPVLEPFGLAPLEANACGTAVVGIPEGGLRETIQTNVNGYLATSCSPSEIGDAIQALTCDLEHAKSIGQKARKHVETYWSISASQRQLEFHLQEVASPPS